MINSVVIQGRLARDPEIKTTQSGVAVANFTVCWSDRYKETETRLFLPCKAWRGTAEFIEKYFRLCLHELSGIMALSQRRGCHHGEITASA